MDLDGTLSKVNTFTLFVKVFFRFSPAARLPLMRIVLQRKLRLISHAEAKQNIISLFRQTGNRMIVENTIHHIINNVRPDLLDAVRKADFSVLATAAPSLYAEELTQRLGFNICISTPDSGPECRGEAKVRRLHQIGIVFSKNLTVYTDHYDDMPLLSANSQGINILVSPSGETLARTSVIKNLYDINGNIYSDQNTSRCKV